MNTPVNPSTCTHTWLVVEGSRSINECTGLENGWQRCLNCNQEAHFTRDPRAERYPFAIVDNDGQQIAGERDCPADAPNVGKSSEGSASAPGTQPAPSSGLDGLTLFERLMLAEMKELNETLGYMAFLMGEHTDLDEDDEPGAQTRDISGRPIQ